MPEKRFISILFNLFLFASVIFIFQIDAMSQAMPQSGYTPHRVYSSGNKGFSDFEAMLADLARADVVFVGEQHDDPMTHRLERAMLEGLARRRPAVVVAMEMFERDVQQNIENYFSGKLAEEEFLKNSRPWPNYQNDYRPLVEFARAHNWRVIASNMPRSYASQVAKQGMSAIDAITGPDRGLIAEQFQCLNDDYYRRFAKMMGSHPDADGKNPETAESPERKTMIEKFYQAQCVKDETMAESVAKVFSSPGESQSPLVIHFNGAFHSDYRMGTAARVERRLPKSKIKVVSIIPIEDLDAIKTDEDRKRGDYIIYTIKSPKKDR